MVAADVSFISHRSSHRSVLSEEVGQIRIEHELVEVTVHGQAHGCGLHQRRVVLSFVAVLEMRIMRCGKVCRPIRGERHWMYVSTIGSERSKVSRRRTRPKVRRVQPGQVFNATINNAIPTIEMPKCGNSHDEVTRDLLDEAPVGSEVLGWIIFGAWRRNEQGCEEHQASVESWRHVRLVQQHDDCIHDNTYCKRENSSTHPADLSASLQRGRLCGRQR